MMAIGLRKSDSMVALTTGTVTLAKGTKAAVGTAADFFTTVQ